MLSKRGVFSNVWKGGGEVTGLAPDVIVPPEFRRGVADNETEIRQRVRELVAGRGGPDEDWRVVLDRIRRLRPAP